MESKISLPNFPNSREEQFILTSPQSPLYNCIAWAYGDNEKWFWPDSQYNSYWPETVKRSVELSSFIELFQSIGYIICDNDDKEEDFLKIAIYTDDIGIPTHAARQLDNGLWTSKLGQSNDVSHSIYSMNNGYYGNATVFMKKKNGA